MRDIVYTALGLMSGTSLDGIDAALIRTDGRAFVERIAFRCDPYAPDLRRALRGCLGLEEDIDGRAAEAERAMTLAHAETVCALVSATGIAPDIIGFHGQTIRHDPAARFTWQLGDGALLARETDIDVIFDFRSADVAAGGQGAPFLPLYHRALVRSADLPLPVAVLNVGGVANVTWIGEGEADILAFDTGPGNALMDDWMAKVAGAPFDRDGASAARGRVDGKRLESWLADPYFARRPPKSLDRDAWTAALADGLGADDGAATLAAFTVETAARAGGHFPQPAGQWYVTGGGRHNAFLMRTLAERLKAPVDSVDALGWNGDAMEAEGFAYLAVRSMKGLPLSLPGTTGVPAPTKGGRFAPVDRHDKPCGFDKSPRKAS